MSTLFCKREYDLSKHYQKVEAAGLFFLVANNGFDGRLAPTMMLAGKPHSWFPELDGRTAEAKAFKEAELKMYNALAHYDATRLAAIAKSKEKQS